MGPIGHRTTEKQVERMDFKARIEINIGQREEILAGRYPQTGLFPHLTRNALLGRLLHIGKATGQVEGAFGGLFLASYHEQLVMTVDNQGRSEEHTSELQSRQYL